VGREALGLLCFFCEFKGVNLQIPMDGRNLDGGLHIVSAIGAYNSLICHRVYEHKPAQSV